MIHLGDVGQSNWGEIDAAPLESVGYNFGRPQLEARSCWFSPTGCQTAGVTMPVVQYGQDEGCSVTGADVYRGTQIRELMGHHWCTGSIRSFRLENGTAGEVKEWTELGNVGQVSSFGLDAHGEQLVATTNGVLARFVPVH